MYVMRRLRLQHRFLVLLEENRGTNDANSHLVNGMALVNFECPKCKGLLCELSSIHNPNFGVRLGYWFCLLFPSFAINELILGLRIPSEMYICKSCALDKPDRSYLHCPTCDTFTTARYWSYGKAFGNWLGLFCPICGGKIPTLSNLTSRAVILITAPFLWLPFQLFQRRLLVSSRNRVLKDQNVDRDNLLVVPPNKPINYKLIGLGWGITMNVCFSLCWAIQQSQTQHLNISAASGVLFLTFFISLIGWLPAGYIFGYLLQHRLSKRAIKHGILLAKIHCFTHQVLAMT